MVRAAFQAQRSFLVLASQCQEPQEVRKATCSFNKQCIKTPVFPYVINPAFAFFVPLLYMHCGACFDFNKYGAVIIRKSWVRVKNFFCTNAYKITEESKGGVHFTVVGGINLSLEAGNAME